ncbi:hypothetical protein [Akkermansia sp.]|nr:hypothetical protein [Akkermansia sp.]
MKEKIKTLLLGLFAIIIFAAFAAILVAAAIDALVQALHSVNTL